MKKRLLSSFLALCMVLVMLPGTAKAAESGTCGANATWTLANGVLTISGSGPMTNYTAWYEHSDPIQVELVGNTPWFRKREIKKVIINEGITEIGGYAFMECTGLTQVEIPNSVTKINTGAFYGCESLTRVVIPNGVSTIGVWAFIGCSSLTYIELPDSVTSIKGQAFQSCTSLTNITLPKNLNYIGNFAFAQAGLKMIEIPNSITMIPEGAFARCVNLESVVIPDTVTKISISAFEGTERLKSLTIPNSVTTIESGAFSRSGLTRITIPASVTALGSRSDGNHPGDAFSGCPYLTEITVDDANPNYTSVDGVVFSKNKDTILGYPSGRSGSYSIPDGTTKIDEWAFFSWYDIKLTSVTIPSSVTSGLDGAFSRCKHLTDVTFLDGTTCIGASMFGDCTSLKNVTIPNSITAIKDGAFGGCTALTGLSLPSGVTAIADRTFAGCTGLRTLTVPKGVTSIGEGAFIDCTSLSSVVLQEGVTSIGDNAFKNCENLTRLVLPDSLTSIGHQAFWHCFSLTSVGPVGGNDCIQIGWKTEIPDYAFYHAAVGAGGESSHFRLKSVTIPEGVTRIGHHAFDMNPSPTSVTIPKSVITIGDIPFRDSVKDVYYAGSKEDWEKITISTMYYSSLSHWLDSATIHYGVDSNDLSPSIQSVTLTQDGQTIDLLTTPQTYTQNSEETASVSASVDWDGVEGGRVFLLQNRDTYVEFTSQSATFAPGKTFAPDQQIYVVATNADATKLLDWKKTKLQIVQATPPDTPQVSISPETLDLSLNKTGEVTVTTTPAGARYNLTSSDPEVVSVSGKTLTAHKLGRVEVTAALVDHPDVTAVCSVAVKDGYDDLMCAIAASQLSYEAELIRYGFGATVETFADAAIGPDRTLWNWAVWDAPLSDFYKDVLGDWKIVNVVSKSSGLFAVALDNEERNERIIALRGTESPKDVWADMEFAILNKLPGQFSDAVDFYKRSAGDGRQILLTGHSLGGAIACYISLLTGERAEVFNAANGLIMEDAYFAGGEDIYRNFHGADRWNFTNHVTESKNSALQFSLGTAAFNEAVAYPNADRLPVEIHAPAITATTGAVDKNSCHDLCSMLEYDRSTGRFWLTQSTPYRQTLPDVRQFEMTRVDALYFMRKAMDICDLKDNPAVFILEQIIFSVSGLQGFLEEHIGAYEKVFFAFGSSGDDTIAAQKIIEQVFLFGGDGNDFLNGGCINDVLVGGLGRNAMDGGPMNDLYVTRGTSDQYINDCSGVDDIYIPSGVRVRSYENPTDKVDEYYVLTLTNGQRIMINKNRKQDFDNRFRVYSMDGTYCGSYRTVPQDTKTRMMALAAEDEPAAAANGLPITTLEFSGRGLMLEIQDDAGNAVGKVNTASDSFPLYKPYGYFYYDNQEGTLRAHLFGGSGEVKVSSADPSTQTIACTSIFHHAEDDLPVKRFTARVELRSSESILTPSCVAEEPAVPFKVMDSSGETQVVPTKTEDLTGSESPDVPVPEQPEQPSSGSGGWSAGTCAVTVKKPEHGKVTSNHTDAASGSTVTLTVVPDSGYVLDTMTVTDSRGDEIKLTAQGGGKYTFAMPGRAVTVTAIFKPLPDKEKESCDGGADCPSRDFSDLGGVETWYHEAVDYVLQNNLMNGYDSGLFGPDNHLSHAQLVQILFNKEGRPIVNYLLQYDDVATGAWYTEAVRWATSQGIVGGYGNGKFGPDDPITREQLTVMLWRYAGEPAATNKELHFNDADKASDYALDALRWAVENGIINGKGGGILDPKGPATRVQVAQILKNYLDK